ncbi:MAG: hypothetical protein EP344_11845 [Bacteroidetes bacterium]|nr:MAG: hypothetical protein EP344_11845 [Bacteroidota bacterium]
MAIDLTLFGRLHPLLVHLPIGILILAYGLECLVRWRQRHDLKPAVRLALQAGAFSAVLTAASGWILGQVGDYGPAALQWHQWTGTGVAVLSVLLCLRALERWYFPLFTVLLAGLVLAGHFGGTLTHGAGYVLGGAGAVQDTAAVDPDTADPDATVYSALVQPVFRQKCVSCHNAKKQKGKLRLDDPQLLLQGGKHGPVLDKDIPEQSRLFQRIRLPLQHDEHMPPAGKPQLTTHEQALLEWWIQAGADFTVKLNDVQLPDKIRANLNNKQEAIRNPVYAIKQPAADPVDIQRLQEQLVYVEQLGAEVPWLAVSFAGISRPGPGRWEALKKIRSRIIDLDLANTELEPEFWSDLQEFTHLIRLNLAHSNSGDALRSVIPRLRFLETLNLTNTPVTDALIEELVQLPELKRLFIWQTDITPAGEARIRRQRPDLVLETGTSLVDTLPLALRPPRIVYNRSFFTDTIQVRLDYPAFNGVSLYYSLDEAASPTTSSARYSGPIVLDQTAHVRAFAAKPGWLSSPITDAVLVKKRYTPVGAVVLKPPSPSYPAAGASSLIDGKISALQGGDTWLGYQGEHLQATLDMGQSRSLRQVFVHCLENNAPWIFKPVAIRVEVSADGRAYTVAGYRRFEENRQMGDQQTHLLRCPLDRETEARYVRVTVLSPLRNPAWHPSKGDKCWIFVDEIVVE